MSALDPGALSRLLRLCSPTLPVGGYSYSQGLEYATDQGWVQDEASALAWITDVREFSVAAFEAPLLNACLQAWAAGNSDALGELNARFLASRECAEFHAETLQMGYSLRRVPGDNEDAREGLEAVLAGIEQPSYPLLWSHAAWRAGIGPEPALTGYLWAWTENQVLGAIKLVPLGQSAGQRMLARLNDGVADLVEGALRRRVTHWCNFAPGLAMAGALHETQYSRLFRS